MKHITERNAKRLLKKIQKKPYQIRFYRNATVEMQLAAVRGNGSAIQYIPNPPEIVQMAAVTNKPRSLKYIIHPSKKVQEHAMTFDITAIKYVDNPSEEFQRRAMNDWITRLIKHPSETIQQAFVKRLIHEKEQWEDQTQLRSWSPPDISELGELNEMCESVQLDAIKHFEEAIRYIKHPTEKAKLFHKMSWVL